MTLRRTGAMTMAEARRLSKAVDKALGYPKRGKTPDGRSSQKGATLTHGSIFFDGTSYSYEVTADMRPLVGRTVATDEGDVTIAVASESDVTFRTEGGVGWFVDDQARQS